MSDKERIELSGILDWWGWFGSDPGEALEWMYSNKDEWILLLMGFRHGDKKALEQYELYLNLDAPDRETFFRQASGVIDQVIDGLKERIEKEIAEQPEAGSNGKNSEMSGVGVRDPGDQGQSGGNGGKAIEC